MNAHEKVGADLEDKRLIEVDFPLKEVSEESVREKNIRQGHISTLHIWWARRPLAASRATIFAALITAPKEVDELSRKMKFITDLSKWGNSLNQRLIEISRKEIRDTFEGRVPKVLDCFAGGGSIPLEALRLGCETYALEYNPVAVLILKAVLEYPQRFGRGKVKTEGRFQSASYPLLDDLKKWGNWVLEEVEKEIGEFYPHDPDGSVQVGYIWARTIRCQNPSCKAEIPLMRQLWLVRKENSKIALRVIIDKKNKKINFKVVQGKEIDFDPSQGTTRRATVLCPICGAGVDDKTVRKLFQEERASQRLVAVVLHHPQKKGKTYRIAIEKDSIVFDEAKGFLEKKRERLMTDLGFDPVPDESLPPKETLGFRVQRYGMIKWGDLFNSRQKLTLITFMEKVREAYDKILAKDLGEYAKVVVSYLGILLDGIVDHNSILCQWRGGTEDGGHTFGRQSLSMTWDYFEINPISSSTGSIQSGMKRLLRVTEHHINCSNIPATVIQSSATSLPYPDNYFDAVITDPPYYDNVPYSYLSDFFYVWLKRAIGDLYLDLFATPLTPKSDEIVTYSHGKEGFEGGKKFFENMIVKAFREIYRVLKPEGIACIVFAHKSTDAWETIINSLFKSGLVLTASWPIHTEMKVRLRAKESSAMASSVYMVCRKRTEEKVAYFNEIREEIGSRIKEKLMQFWEQGISGADFFVSAIGPAVEVFGKYSRVEKLSGEEVSVQELLEHVRKVVSEFALERVLKRADLGGVDAETRFYLLWRWTFKNVKVHFDDAIKLSRPMGIELTNLWDSGGFVRKEKEFVRVLDPKERAKDPSFMKKTKFTSMIDVLHHAVILWEKGDRKKIKEILDETGYSGNEVFWQTAQAISEILPEGDKERQLLQGFLLGRETYIREVEEGKSSLLDFMEGERK